MFFSQKMASQRSTPRSTRGRAPTRAVSPAPSIATTAQQWPQYSGNMAGASFTGMPMAVTPMQWIPMTATAATADTANLPTPEVLLAPSGHQDRRDRRSQRMVRDAENLRSLPLPQAAMRIIVRTMMDEKSDILRSLMLQPSAVTVPAIDAWAGLVAAERNGERAAKEKVSQLKEIMAKSVEEYKGMIASGSSFHQIAESVGVKERSQSQNLPPFKTRVADAALVCSSAEMTLSMDVQSGHLKVVTDDGHMVTSANGGPSVAVIDRCFDGIHPYLTLSAIANGVSGFDHVLWSAPIYALPVELGQSGAPPRSTVHAQSQVRNWKLSC